MTVYESEVEDIIPGDIVAVRHGIKGHQEGLVKRSYYDSFGRQVIEVVLDGGITNVVYPSVTHVKRVIYSRPSLLDRRRTIERRIYW
ncbi:hypothetical protein CVT24_012807 [Panaeolus cyanescens]|uniref:Hypervirulence associated protein TUDOR domain-containing protein n=1 Tax=Panaeolus cyanescens TaxID=181874 RepID=A0A409W2N2_9AGAR|nr:hypothetical protein CVT24_012807 [Panaeolus cyanescens]